MNFHPFLCGIIITFCLSSLLAAEEKHGSFQIGEGGEVVVTEGIIVRESPAENGELPLLSFGSASGKHFIYDPNQLTMQGFWNGLFGRLNGAGDFVPGLQSLNSFSLSRYPWSYGEKGRRTLTHDWHGYQIRDNRVFLKYLMKDDPSRMSWEVEESLEIISETVQRIHFTITPSQETDLYLNYWVTQTDFRRLTTNGQPNQRNKLKNLFPNQSEFSITFVRRKQTPTVPNGYSISTIPIPTPKPPFLFEPTDIDFADNGDIYVSTRTGQIWRRHQNQWSVFADGLHEANGIRVTPDGILVMQKPELTRLVDTEGDGTADLYQTVEDRFRFSGHYHEFAYGPRINQQGDMFFTLGLASSGYHLAAPERQQNQMTSALGYRGWVMKRSADGKIIPFASGLRSPAGIGINHQDELFITDNQGDWVASSYLGHVEQGDFLGQPASLWDRPEYGVTPKELGYADVTKAAVPEQVPPLDREQFTRERKHPAVWLSHGDLTNSPGHPSFAPETGFGPFGGQAFIADIAHRNIVRVALEKVNGKYQGAVFPFTRPLSSSSYSTAFDSKGNLWIGSVGRGWTAGDPTIEMIQFDPSQKPFEIHRIALTDRGFDIHFTDTINSTSIAREDILVTEFRYEYWPVYGSEPVDEKNISVVKMELSTDQSSLSIELPRHEGYIYQIQLPSITSANGLKLENNYGIYTLNQLLP